MSHYPSKLLHMETKEEKRQILDNSERKLDVEELLRTQVLTDLRFCIFLEGWNANKMVNWIAILKL